MIEDARAKIRLSDGREVWRHVYLRYREVETGRWISRQEAETLWVDELLGFDQSSSGTEQLRQKIMDVQAELALDRDGGSRSTHAARLVLGALNEMADEDDQEGKPVPWFILGQHLAEKLLVLVEGEKTGKK